MCKRNRHISYLLGSLLFLLPLLSNAQPGFGDDVNDVPIDGGLSVLVAAGIGYGLKKMKTKSNNIEHKNKAFV